jgi:hygromycin-B 7''-O-kinase
MVPAISRDEYRAVRGDPRRWHDAIVAIATRHGLGAAPVQPLGGSNLVAAAGVGGTRVVKLFPPFLRDQWDSERVALAVVHGALAPVVTPELLHVGELDGWPYLVMTRLEGASLEDVWPEAAAEHARLLEQIGALIAQVHALDPGPIAALGPHWDDFLAAQRAGCVARHTRLALPAPLLAELDAYLDRVAPAIPRAGAPVILTGEYTPANLLVTRRADRWQLTGLIDFGDAWCGAPDYDLLGPATFLAAGDPARLRALLVARGYAPGDLVPALRDRLMALLLLHRHSDLDMQLRIPDWRGRAHSLDQLAALVFPLPCDRTGEPGPTAD